MNRPGARLGVARRDPGLSHPLGGRASVGTMAHDVRIVTVPSRTVAATRFAATEAAQIAQLMEAAFTEVVQTVAALGRTPVAPAVAFYEPTAAGWDVCAGFPLDGEEPPPQAGVVGPVEIPGGEVATTTHVGSYDTLPEAYADVDAQVSARGRTVAMDRPMWEEYWSGPDAPPEETRTVVYLPLAAPA